MELKAGLNPEQEEYLEKLKAELEKISGGRTAKEIVAGGDLESMERFVAKKEEIVEFLRTREIPETELERKFELRKQYEDQIETLRENGLIKELPNGEMGFLDINGKPRSIPTYEEIRDRLRAKQELREKKHEQGFTQLLLVPFGIKLNEMVDKAKELILKKHKEGNLKGTNGDDLELDEDEPVWLDAKYQGGDADQSGDLIYYPEKFDKENHGGKTKQEILEETDGWDVMFIEDLPDLPAEGKGKEIGGRKQLEANQSPNQYLEKMQKEEQYEGERGMTPEAELVYFMHYLQRKNKVIDDWRGSGKGNWNLGGYLKSAGGVCFSRWSRGDRQMRLRWYNPVSQVGDCGVRSSARI